MCPRCRTEERLIRRVFVIAVVLALFAVSTAHAKRTPTTQQIICQVFGSDCPQALCHAYRESRFQTWAANGQYLGIFQMGSHERALFGHGSDAWSQARAAKRYFDNERAHGRSGWGPWGGYC